jgi:hypothetical protein
MSRFQRYIKSRDLAEIERYSPENLLHADESLGDRDAWAIWHWSGVLLFFDGQESSRSACVYKEVAADPCQGIEYGAKAPVGCDAWLT